MKYLILLILISITNTACTQSAKEHYQKGNDLLKEKKYQEAITSYDAAILLDSVYAFAYNNKGRALHELGKYEDATACFDKVIALNPIK